MKACQVLVDPVIKKFNIEYNDRNLNTIQNMSVRRIVKKIVIVQPGYTDPDSHRNRKQLALLAGRNNKQNF